MHYRILKYLFTFSMLTALTASWGRDPMISLAGEWLVRLDSDSSGVARRYFSTVEGSAIELPGTLDIAGYGAQTSGADYGILSRRHKFIGPAWYNREIVIPRSWNDKEVVLYLDRVMWESRVWVDGREVSVQEGLGTPHRHSLGRLAAGEHILSVRVNNDMIHNIGDKGHAYGQYTQIIWNGILGKIELRALENLAIARVKTWPEASAKNLRLTFDIQNRRGAKKAIIQYIVREKAAGNIVKIHSEQIALANTITHHTTNISIAKEIKLWDEFTPNLYTVEISLKNGASEVVDFGFREITTSRNKIIVNGRPTWLRGNLDCVHFPLTGSPSCEVEEWARIFQIYKNHGLNQVRFHSWCPPDAAFEAADRLGIYIQAEAIWIDWWMSVINKERPEMTTRGLPKGLGHNPSADAYVKAELRRMVEAYGNHPSFMMMCIGNELGNSDFEVMQRWIDELKNEDNRRIYSVSTARQITPADQYMVTHNIPQIGATYGLQEGRGTDFDLESNYSQAEIPIIAHELGQFPVHPLWSEIKKYTGTLEARNLQQLKELAAANGLEKQDSAFRRASGALQTILYKALLENLARTPSCAGFSLLSMSDYSGQGEALVGWLDSFWDSKNLVTPETFRGYSNDVMLLARFPKYTWSGGERFTARLQTANYSLHEITESARWTLKNSAEETIAAGLLTGNAKPGELNSIGEIALDLPKVTKAEKLTLTTYYDSLGRKNSWHIWLFPETAKPTTHIQSKLHITTDYDDHTRAILERGGSVLLLADSLGRDGVVTPLNFSPLFWSSSFFPGQTNKTLGLLINAAHPALAHFPTETHTDWQWQSLCRGQSFILNAHPQLAPIVQPISDFHISNRLGSIFECRVGAGKLLICGHNVSGSAPEAKSLKHSLIDYANSSKFNPTYSITHEELEELLYTPHVTQNELPTGFEKAILYAKCGALSTADGSSPWSKETDKILVASDCGYSVTCNDTWRDASGTAWTGAEIVVEISTPNGILCDLYVKFSNPNRKSRSGVVAIEGRESTIKDIPAEGKWTKLFVMREDTNDGKIILRARTTTGENLMISEIALVKQ